MKKNISRALIISAMTFAFLEVSAFQINDDVETTKKLKKEYPEESWVATRFQSHYNFIEGRRGALPIVENTEELQTITLNTIEKCRLAWFYDDNSKISSEKITYKNGRKVIYDKVCGNFENEGVFYSDAKVCVFQLNNQKIGDVVYTNLSQTYNDVRYFTKVFFHEKYPIEEREIFFSIPTGMVIDLVEVNFEGYKIEKTKIENAKEKSTEYKYIIRKIPGLDTEENTLGPAHIYPHLLIMAKSYTLNGKPQKIISSVDDLYEWYTELAGKTQNDPASLASLVKQLTSNAKTDIEKVKNIFYWVQDNIRYIAFEDGIAGFKPEEAQGVFLKKYGDCKGMANLTKAMLQIAGLDGRLTWIGTSRLPYTFQTPCLGINNHMICTWISGDKKYFLDPTEKFIAFDKYAARIQNQQVLIENGKKYILDKIPESNYEPNLIEYKEQLSIIDQKMVGKARIKVNGESKVEFLRLYDLLRNDKKSTALHNVLTRNDKNIDVENIKTSDLQNREAELSIDYDISASNRINKFGDDLYIEIDLQKNYQALTFDDKRVNNYTFHQKIYQKNQVIIEVPDQYKIKHLPADMSFKNDDFSFFVSFINKGNQIFYNKTIIINKGLIKKSQFKIWNNAIAELNKIYEDQIILTH